MEEYNLSPIPSAPSITIPNTLQSSSKGIVVGQKALTVPQQRSHKEHRVSSRGHDSQARPTRPTPYDYRPPCRSSQQSVIRGMNSASSVPDSARISRGAPSGTSTGRLKPEDVARSRHLKTRALSPLEALPGGKQRAHTLGRTVGPAISKRELARYVQVQHQHGAGQSGARGERQVVAQRPAGVRVGALTNPHLARPQNRRDEHGNGCAAPGQTLVATASVHSQPKQARNLSGIHHIAKNIGMLLSGQAVTWICTLILTAAYGRFLGASAFGELYLATTFTSLVGFPIEYSFNQQIVRDVARAPHAAYRYITMGLALKGGLWVTLYALALLLSVLLGYPSEQRWIIAICGIMLISTAISTTLISIQTAYMQVGLAKVGTVIEKLFDTIVAVALLRVGAGVETVALVLLLGSIAGMGWQVVRVARMVGFRWEWDTEVARSLIRSGLSFLAYGVLGVIYYRVDTLLLSMLASTVTIGVYGAAYRLFDTLAFVPGVLVGAIMSPILAKYSVTNMGKLREAVERSLIAMLLCSLPVAAGLIVTAPDIIQLVYHRHAFAGSALVLEALAPGLIALFLNSVLTTVLVSTGQERKLPLTAGAALVFNVILNLLLIPRFAEIGSAWATTLTEVLLLVIGFLLVDRSLISFRLWAIAGKILVACGLMTVVAYALATLSALSQALGAFSILVIIPIAAMTYLVAVMVLRVLPRDEMQRLTSVFSRRAVRIRSTSTERVEAPPEEPEGALAMVAAELEAVS